MIRLAAPALGTGHSVRSPDSNPDWPVPIGGRVNSVGLQAYVFYWLDEGETHVYNNQATGYPSILLQRKMSDARELLPE